MKYELLTIENAIVIKQKKVIFSNLYLQVFRSDIISIIIDRVAQKKFLLDFFKGSYTLFSGKLYSCEKDIPIESASVFMKDNVSVIEPNTKLISSLKIEENILLFSDNSSTYLKKKYQKKFAELIEQFNLNHIIENSTWPLSYKNRIIVELLKAYVENKSIIVLSELTGLSIDELNEIYLLINQLKEKQMSFVIIEPVDSVVYDWISQVYVIQHGKSIGMFDSKSVNRHKIYTTLTEVFNLNEKFNLVSSQNIKNTQHGKSVLEFKNVSNKHIKNLNLSIESGEIIKMLYLDDESCDGIVGLLNGSIPIQSGEILLNDQSLKIKNIYNAVKKGICFVNEPPYNNMLFYNMSVRDNLAITLSHKENGLWLKPGYMKSIDDYIINTLNKKILHNKLKDLDPIALQQIAYLKWILYSAKVVVCIKPFSDIDVHLAEVTIKMIEELENHGISVIVLSSNIAAANYIKGTTVFFKSGKMVDADEYHRFFYKATSSTSDRKKS